MTLIEKAVKSQHMLADNNLPIRWNALFITLVHLRLCSAKTGSKAYTAWLDRISFILRRVVAGVL